MNCKILLKVENQIDFETYKGDYDGVYFSNPLTYICPVIDKEVFIDVSNVSPTLSLNLSKTAPQNATFVVDDVVKAVFIKSVNDKAKISYKLESYNENILPFIKANGFDVTVKYTTLAPERIEKFHQIGAKLNGATLSRLDEAGVLDFWKIDYVTIIPQIKP